MQQLLSERIRHRSPFAYVLLVFSYVTASKISLMQVQGCEKRNPTQIHKLSPKIRSENLNSRNLDRSGGVEEVSSFKPRQIQLSRSCRGDKSFLDRSTSYREVLSYLSTAVERCRATVEPSIHRCRAICPTLMNSFSSLISWSNVHGFNTRLEQHVS